MIYLCNIKNGKLYLQRSFDTEQEFAAYLTDAMFDHILMHQRLTATDICRKIVYPYSTNQPVLYEHERNIQILDELGRILDVRDFIHLIPTDISVYNIWKKKQSRAFRIKHRSQKQGEAHKKWGHYKYLHKSVPPDKNLLDIDETLRHRNRRLRCIGLNYYTETWTTTENNWKEQKIRHQYMWHKPKHKDTCCATKYNDLE